MLGLIYLPAVGHMAQTLEFVSPNNTADFNL